MRKPERKCYRILSIYHLSENDISRKEEYHEKDERRISPLCKEPEVRKNDQVPTAMY